MKGNFSELAFTKRRYAKVTMEEGQVQLDADWNERMDVRFHDGAIYLDIWEREAEAPPNDDIRVTALGGPETDLRKEERNDWSARMTSEVGRSGGSSFTVQIALGCADSGVERRSLTLPAPEIRVEGTPWRRVDSFSGASPTDRVYIIRQNGGGNGELVVEFGDGRHGERPRTGAGVSASYRFGGGRSGDKRD